MAAFEDRRAELQSVLQEAHGGCFLATCALPIHDSRYTLPPWALGVADFDHSDSEDNEGGPADLSIDPEDAVLSVINHSSHTSKSFFVTVGNCAHILSAEGVDLLGDVSNGIRRPFITFVVLLPPNSVMDLVTLVPKAVPAAKKKKGRKKAGAGRLSGAELESIGVCSDVQDYIPGPHSFDLVPIELHEFPLRACVERPEGWLCTQASGGDLTHFAHPSTYHAVDFRCAVGTPVVAVFDGTVVEVRKDSMVTGVHVSNLFDFNSIMVKKADEEVYVEYVHIHKEGVLVAVGDEVQRGQVICQSGEAGFCPEPHLHLQVQRGREPDAASVPILLFGRPIVAGDYYPSP